MPLYRCSVVDCSLPGLRGPSGACVACSQRFCVSHVLPCPSHACPSYETNPSAVSKKAAECLEEEFRDLIQRLNVKALAQVASSLRNGQPCQIPELTTEYLATLPRGGMNIHLTIDFDDGAQWICRIRRRNSSALPLEAQDAVISSEAATLKFLVECTRVLVPRIFKVVLPSTDPIANPVGVGYILMEKVRGKEMDWSRLDIPQRRKVLVQLADSFASLYEHPFSRIGCIKLNSSDVGQELDSSPQLSVDVLVGEESVERHDDGSLHFLGPFLTFADYLRGTISSRINQTLARECHIDAIDHYLALQEALASTSAICDRINIPTNSDTPCFYLKHMDDKGDQILLDEDFNITGIIDWEWAQTLPKEFAFSSPLFLFDVGAYYDGEDKLSDDEKLFVDVLEEKGCAELASCVRNGRVVQRLAHLVDQGAATEDLRVHLQSLWRLVYVVDQDWDQWRTERMKRVASDAGLQALAEEHAC